MLALHIQASVLSLRQPFLICFVKLFISFIELFSYFIICLVTYGWMRSIVPSVLLVLDAFVFL